MKNVVFRSEQASDEIRALYNKVLDQLPFETTRLQVETRYGPTFVLASGPVDAPPLVLLHGSQANAASWAPEIPLWATKFRVYAVDMIGEPGLSAPVRPSLHDQSHLHWLDELFEGLQIAQDGSPISIVGVSLGGWLALHYATNRPQRVKALALVCPVGVGRQRNFVLKILPLMLLGKSGQRRARELVLGPVTPSVPADMADLANLLERIGKDARLRMGKLPQLSDGDLRRLDMPVWAVVGAKDVLLDSHDTRRRLERNVPQSQVVLLQEGYHYLPGQGQAILDFLATAAPGLA